MSEHEEHVCLDERRHAAAVAVPLAEAVGLGILGTAAILAGWPFSILGAPALVAAALIAVRAVAQWDRTRVLVTDEKIVLEEGLLRRYATAVPLARLPFIEVERSVLGRLLGYGTIVAGELEITHVPDAGRVYAVSAAAARGAGGREPRGRTGRRPAA